MASFAKAYTVMAGNEGGYTIDNGGETYKGVSRKGWPSWVGWKIIDRLKKSTGRPKFGSYFKSPELDQAVIAFYKKNYWDVIMGDYIDNQEVANFIYDFFVNSNSALAIINRALGARVTNNINEDSLHIINERPAMAYQTIWKAREAHYTKLALKPKLKQYKKGWFARLNKFPESIIAGI